jgi:hypothetical protein
MCGRSWRRSPSGNGGGSSTERLRLWTFEEEVLAALLHMGYAIEMDWRPNRVELGAPGRGWIDLHPFVLDDEGNARQAAIGGG